MGSDDPGAAETLRAAAYAAIALHQHATLEQIATGAHDLTFPSRSAQAPDWFAAAAGQGSRLAQVAPELTVELDAETTGELDLIRMYAPELLEGVDTDPVPVHSPAHDAPQGLRVELLAALAELDD